MSEQAIVLWQENRDLETARQIAIDILDKAQPMKPGSAELGVDGRIIRPCGNCGEDLKTILWAYCPWCGQKIDWSGEK